MYMICLIIKELLILLKDSWYTEYNWDLKNECFFPELGAEAIRG